MTLVQEEVDKIHQLCTYLGIGMDKILITEEPELISVTIDVPEEEAGMYIGRFATTIDSLQLLISLMLNQDRTNHRHILLDIGGYRARRGTTLEEMVKRVSEEVTASGVARALPPISSTERRQVHLMLSDHETLTTFSQGEGQDRRLFIAPRTN